MGHLWGDRENARVPRIASVDNGRIVGRQPGPISRPFARITNKIPLGGCVAVYPESSVFALPGCFSRHLLVSAIMGLNEPNNSLGGDSSTLHFSRGQPGHNCLRGRYAVFMEGAMSFPILLVCCVDEAYRWWNPILTENG